MSLKGVYPWHPNLHCTVDNYYELLEEMTLAPKTESAPPLFVPTILGDIFHEVSRTHSNNIE